MSDGARASRPAAGFAGVPAALLSRLRGGEVGSLPVIAGLALIWAVFWTLNPNFLTPGNLTNLVLQIAAMGTIAIGIVLVLLLGEIDLSVGALSGVSAAVMAVLNVKSGVPAPLAILAGLATGAVIGLFQGFWFTWARVPSFVVTLAGLLAWQGALLMVLGQTGTVNLLDPTIDGLTATFLPPAVGWLVAALAIAAQLGAAIFRRRRRAAAGLPVDRGYGTWALTAVVSAVVIVATAILNLDRGIPLALLIVVCLVIAFEALGRKTRFGRSIYAVGGNAEAARRAGVSINRVRVAVFGITGCLAAAGGILGASRLLAVNQSSGGSDLLLDSIAAAVIGGTSLFGGRGSVWSALTGALVIGSISNGMDLLALASSIKFIVTGAVLLAAVSLDALARRGREVSGKA